MLHADQARIRTFRVVPALPEALGPLMEIAKNLWWTWNPEAIALFSRLDPELWTATGHNPIRLLGSVDQDRLDQAARDESYLHEVYRVYSALNHHTTRRGWFNNVHGEAQDAVIAYFSAEFGLTECFQIYAGGLGILAGDHLKSASELGVPLVGIGLLYQHGYFMQYLNADGWQQETYPDLDFGNQPIEKVQAADGRWLRVTVRLPGRDVKVGVWRAQVGRIPLFLLDTNIRENSYDDRQITRNLYGGDVETRIQQEIVLGIGGTRALAGMGIKPTVCHINEGHAAFLNLERIRMIIAEHNVSFEEARQMAAAGNVFTTHTPVPAGIDRFHPSLIDQCFRDYVGDLRISVPQLLDLGREHPGNNDEYFSMAVLAIRTSYGCNGVSKLHGNVSRAMWRGVWPGAPEEEVPITHVTNGVHTRSWISREMAQLFDRYLGYRWQHEPTDHSVWEHIEDVPDEELWAIHTQRRRKLITWARRRIREQCRARGASTEQTELAVSALDPDALTIGFARRFATYKRGTLLMADRARLMRLLSDQKRPIQIIMAGKAHPADAAGKEFIREIFHFPRALHDNPRAFRVVFLENYDMNVARYLVTGCDIWLNTPRRGLEASGTSGMKAAMNGVINCSILDGWWDEAYEHDLGYAIGRREQYPSEAEADEIESSGLYDLFENRILPEFYDRDAIGLPRRWIGRMKRCIQALAPAFNTNRMVQEYAEKLYVPAHLKSRDLAENNLEGAKGLASKLQRYHEAWHEVRVETVRAETRKPLPVRTPLPVEAVVHLGRLEPNEVEVQLYTGRVSGSGDLVDGEALPMSHAEALEGGKHRFTGALSASQSGRRGLSVRVIPHDNRLPVRMIPRLICWDSPESQRAAAGGRSGDQRHPHAGEEGAAEEAIASAT